MKKTESEKKVQDHYNAVAEGYGKRYQKEFFNDLSVKYPANYFRLQLLINSFTQKGLKRLVEVGVGEGTPLAIMAKAGFDIAGFDISESMVEKCQETLKKHDVEAVEEIFHADIQDPVSYIQIIQNGLFDGLMAMGVMPHVDNDDMVLDNMANLVRPGGSVFIEFRNKLFSLFTFNRHTYDFILDDLLQDVNPKLKDVIAEDLKGRVRMDLPEERNIVEGTNAPGYDAITSKYHNPFEVTEFFKRHNFQDIKLQWYHYHPAFPFLNEKEPELFRQEAMKLEHEPSNWRGMFLCSAFVVEAVKAS